MKKILSRKQRFDSTKTEASVDQSQNIIKPQIQYMLYNIDSLEENPNVTDIHSLYKLLDSDKNFWVNVYGLHDTNVIQEVCKELGMHPIFINDILDTARLSRIQKMDDYLVFTIKSHNFENDTLSEEHLSFILGDDYLFTFQEKKSSHFEHLRKRLRDNSSNIRKNDNDYLFYLQLESILDNYEETIDNIETRINTVAKVDINNNVDPEILIKISKLQNNLNTIKKNITPIIDALSKLENGFSNLIEKENQIYFSYIKNTAQHLSEIISIFLQNLDSRISIYFSYQDQKLNQIMKLLTMVSTIFIPLTFIAGIYGMNFDNMPELRWQNGYFVSLVIMLIISIALILYFKRKKWF